MDAYRDQYATLFRNGRGIVLLAISVDPADALGSWARDADYPFLFLADPGGEVGRRYGAYDAENRMDDRTLFVIAPDGTISYVESPFREIDPQAYTDLGKALEQAAGPGGR